eukprot:1606135-Amphidinium_carterae.2
MHACRPADTRLAVTTETSEVPVPKVQHSSDSQRTVLKVLAAVSSQSAIQLSYFADSQANLGIYGKPTHMGNRISCS